MRRMKGSLPNSRRGKGRQSRRFPGAGGTAGTRDALCKPWPQEKLWPESPGRLCLQELLLQTPAGLLSAAREGEEAAFWVTESQGLLTQVTRHPGSVRPEHPGHLSPPAPVPSGPGRGKGIAPERGSGSCWSWK